MLTFLGPFLNKSLFDKTIFTKLIAYIDQETDIESLEPNDKKLAQSFMKNLSKLAMVKKIESINQ